MGFLYRFGILAKVMASLAALAVVAVLITLIGLGVLRSQRDASREIERTSLSALEAAKLTIHATALNSAEFQLAGDPTERTVRFVRERVSVHLTELRKHLQAFRELAKPADREASEQLSRLVSDYERELEITLKAGDKAATDGNPDAVAALRREAEISQGVVGRLSLSARSFVTDGEAQVRTATAAVDRMYGVAAVVLAGMAGLGIAAGLAFGYYVTKRGIVHPIRSVTDVLGRLATGELPPDIEGTDRKDEVGRLAAAAMGLRDMGKTLRRLQDNDGTAREI